MLTEQDILNTMQSMAKEVLANLRIIGETGVSWKSYSIERVSMAHELDHHLDQAGRKLLNMSTKQVLELSGIRTP